jgi:uncharacterized protein
MRTDQIRRGQLLEDGATVPFIARYRKEATGSLDEVAVSAIRDRLTQLQELDSRRETILNSLEQHGHLTDDLKDQVLAAETMTQLEDIYLPYRPKRRTKATIAREKGLEPLALAILAQEGADPDRLAAGYVDPEKAVDSVDDALSGARDIIAETINEDQQARSRVRDLFFEKAVIRSQVVAGKESEGAKYKDYFQWEEPVAKAPSHRILAMRRGEKEDILSLSIAPQPELAIAILEDLFVTGDGPMPIRCGPRPMMPTNACCPGPWRPRFGWPSRNGPMPKPSAFSPTTCANCCWPPPWGPNG